MSAENLECFSSSGPKSAFYRFESAKSRGLKRLPDTKGAENSGNASRRALGPAKSISSESTSKTPEHTRAKIIVLVGLPGAGKSTYVKKRDGVLSSDEIRRLLADNPEDQTIHSRVFGVLRGLLRQRIELRRPVTYIDATNLRRRDRKPYLKMAKLYDCAIEAIFFDVDVDLCQRRNRKRDRVVPEDVIERMATRLQPPSVGEGFDRVTITK